MGRPKKRGNTRMDVAVDTMAALGFSAPIVRQAVKRLLKIYGGDECWVFIEQDAYKVLIEYILEDNYGCDGNSDTPMAIMDAETSTSIGGDTAVAIMEAESSACGGDLPTATVAQNLEADYGGGDTMMAIMDAGTSTAIGGDTAVAIMEAESSACGGDLPTVAEKSQNLEAEQEEEKKKKKKKKKPARNFRGLILDSDDSNADSDDIIDLPPMPLESAMNMLFKGGLQALLKKAT